MKTPGNKRGKKKGTKRPNLAQRSSKFKQQKLFPEGRRLVWGEKQGPQLQQGKKRRSRNKKRIQVQRARWLNRQTKKKPHWDSKKKKRDQLQGWRPLYSTCQTASVAGAGSKGKKKQPRRHGGGGFLINCLFRSPIGKKSREGGGVTNADNTKKAK